MHSTNIMNRFLASLLYAGRPATITITTTTATTTMDVDCCSPCANSRVYWLVRTTFGRPAGRPAGNTQSCARDYNRTNMMYVIKGCQEAIEGWDGRGTYLWDVVNMMQRRTKKLSIYVLLHQTNTHDRQQIIFAKVWRI